MADLEKTPNQPKQTTLQELKALSTDTKRELIPFAVFRSAATLEERDEVQALVANAIEAEQLPDRNTRLSRATLPPGSPPNREPRTIVQAGVPAAVNDALNILKSAQKVVKIRLTRGWADEIAEGRFELSAPFQYNPLNQGVAEDLLNALTNDRPLQRLQDLRLNPNSTIRRVSNDRFERIRKSVELFTRSSRNPVTDSDAVLQIITEWRNAGIPLTGALNDPALAPDRSSRARAKAIMKGQEYIDTLPADIRASLTDAERGLLAEYTGSSMSRRAMLGKQFPAIRAIQAKAKGEVFGRRARRAQAKGEAAQERQAASDPGRFAAMSLAELEKLGLSSRQLSKLSDEEFEAFEQAMASKRGGGGQS